MIHILKGCCGEMVSLYCTVTIAVLHVKKGFSHREE